MLGPQVKLSVETEILRCDKKIKNILNRISAYFDGQTFAIGQDLSTVKKEQWRPTLSSFQKNKQKASEQTLHTHTLLSRKAHTHIHSHTHVIK